MEKSINKYVYTWVGTFLFGIIGVDRFMRGQIKRGILKMIISVLGIIGISLVIKSPNAFGLILSLGVSWFLIDFIIALSNLDHYEKYYEFDIDGYWIDTIINKYVYIWVGTFLFGIIGADRFIRGQIIYGILKIVTFGLGIIGCIFISNSSIVLGLTSLLGGVSWFLIDFIIALTKLGKYGKVFGFIFGIWDESYTKEEIEKEEKEKAEEELKVKERQQQEIERREKYKKDVLSGAISYDKELLQIADEIDKYESRFREQLTNFISKFKEYSNGIKSGSWDSMWYSRITDEIKNINLETLPYNIKTKLSDLKEIKQDSRIKALEDGIEVLREDYLGNSKELLNIQSRLRGY